MKSITKKNKSKIIQVESIRVGLASPERIKKWAERTLPNGKIIGQVTNSQTVNYKTLKPEKGGLFCERIFGPIKDFECACGKKRSKFFQKFCPECDVEFTLSRVRRHRLGYIQLISSVTHVWYLKGIPSYIPILLDLPKKKIEAITYCTETININSNRDQDTTIENLSSNKNLSFNQDSDINFYNFKTKKSTSNNYYAISQDSSWEIQDDWNFFSYYISAFPGKKDILIPFYFNRISRFETQTSVNYPLIGGEAIRNLLLNLDLAFLDRQLRVEIFELNEEITDLENQGFLLFSEQRRLQFLNYIRVKKIRRLKLIRHFRRTKARPEWMILSILPVLPPDLRPIIQLDGDQVAVSDLNQLYQKVLFRNNRMKRHRRFYSSNKSDEIKYSQRLLQEAVDALIENGKGGADPICASNDRPLKSLSDMLKGKKGRFRQNLLGKRVDYSGRSVIVVGPHLKIHECGLPKEMAIELFQPFLIRRLMATKTVKTIVGAKRLIQLQDPLIWESLKQVMKNHPVLLNRAPTLHRLGIQAFQPKLVDGRAILLHPLVCAAFNADFDGDQMAVHVPLSFEARAEAWKLMWSRNNLLSPATGQPIILPSQDMVLGCYYLTTRNSKNLKTPDSYFSDLDDVLRSYYQKEIHIHTFVWVRWNNKLESYLEFEKPLEIRILSISNIVQIYSTYKKYCGYNSNKISQFIRTTAGRILINKTIHDQTFKN